MHQSATCHDGSIRVYARVRPHARAGFDRPHECNPADEVLFADEENRAIILNTKVPRTFAYDGVFGPSASQETVFEDFGRSLVQQVIQGYNGSVFCFGQTGAGKTYTMQGPDAPQRKKCESWGLMPRMIDNIFLSAPKDEQCLFRISYLEIYKETITDLLDPENTCLQIREDFKRGVFVERLSEWTVGSVQEAMAIVRKGIQNRHVAATLMNERSSRSHAVFTFAVETQVTDDRGVTATKVGKLNLIDLAGSERLSDDSCRVREAGAINRSLSVLTSVILQLSQKDKGRHIHYRDSKLTFLLRESLGGNSQTAICANISPLPSSFGETLSTLKFAQRAKAIRTNAVLNQVFSGTVESLTIEVKDLRAQLQTFTRQATPRKLSAGSPGMRKDVEAVNRTHKLEGLLSESVETNRIAEAKQQDLQTYCEFLEKSNLKKDSYINALRHHSTLLCAIGRARASDADRLSASENALLASLDFSDLLDECPMSLPDMGVFPSHAGAVADQLGTLQAMGEKPDSPAFDGVDLAMMSPEHIQTLIEENRLLRAAAESSDALRESLVTQSLVASNQVLRERVRFLETQLKMPADSLPLSGSEESTTVPDGDGESTCEKRARGRREMRPPHDAASKDKTILSDILRTLDAAVEQVERLGNKENNERMLTADCEEKSENVLVHSLLASLTTSKSKQRKTLTQSPSLGALTRNRSTLSLHSVETPHLLQQDAAEKLSLSHAGKELRDPARSSHELLVDICNRMRVLLDALVQAADNGEDLMNELQLLAERYDSRIEETRFWELQCHRLNLHCTQLEDFVRSTKGMVRASNHSYSLSSLRGDAMWKERMRSFKELQALDADAPQAEPSERGGRAVRKKCKRALEATPAYPSDMSLGLSNPINTRATDDNSPPRIIAHAAKDDNSPPRIITHAAKDDNSPPRVQLTLRASVDDDDEPVRVLYARQFTEVSGGDDSGPSRLSQSGRKLKNEKHDEADAPQDSQPRFMSAVKNPRPCSRQLLAKSDNAKVSKKRFDRSHFLALAADKDNGPSAAIAYLRATSGCAATEKR